MSIIKLILVVIITVYYAFKEIFIHLFHLRVDNRVYVNWSKWLNRIIGIKVEVSGLENIKENESYIFVCNHSSLLDIPVLFGTLPGDVRIIYKKELEKIPIFGYALRKSNLIGIERKDPRKSMKSLEEAIETIRAGASVIIFPEGTRESGKEVDTFKRGGFLIAEKALVPIIPIAMVGTYDLLPKGKFNLQSGKVKLSIMEPIGTKTMSVNDIKGLRDVIRTQIIKEIAIISK